MLPPQPTANPTLNGSHYPNQNNIYNNNSIDQCSPNQEINNLATKMNPLTIAGNYPPQHGSQPPNNYPYGIQPQPSQVNPSPSTPSTQYSQINSYHPVDGFPQMPIHSQNHTPKNYNPNQSSYSPQQPPNFMPGAMPPHPSSLASSLPPQVSGGHNQIPASNPASLSPFSQLATVPSNQPSALPGMMPPCQPGVMQPGMPPAGQPGMIQPGMPPVGQPGVLPGMIHPGQPASGFSQRKIDPDLMPSAIDVIENDRSNNSGITFSTGQRGVAPPLVSTEFSCKDEGNCNPRFIRSSLYVVPNSSDLLKSCGLPFTITCCPFAQLHPNDQPVILSDMGNLGPVRCIRCKAYMSPVMSFIDGGRRFSCPLCGGASECPAEYFAHVDHSGRRTDAFQRPELCLGSYELTATAEYCRDNKLPKPPAYIFLLDVSQSALRSGAVNLFCSRFISDILPNLPKDEQAQLQYQYMLQTYEQQIAQGLTPHGPKPEAPQSELSIGFITYDRHLQFYSFLHVKSSFLDHIQNGHVPNGTPTDASKMQYSHPRMNIIADTDEMFVPGVEGFLIPGNNEQAIQELLQMIPQHFMGEGAPPPQSEPLLAPAIQAGMEALKAAERPGKLFILHTSLPTVDAPGRLKNREDRKLIGSDKEKTLLNPVNEFYTTLGQECVKNGCSVDLFIMPTSYIDIATISEVPRLTGGHIYKYNCFLAETHGEDLIHDLRFAVSSPRAFDCVMRIRTSAGTRPVEFFSHGHVPNTTDVEVASIDCNWALTVEIKHDDKLPDGDIVFIQAAVLYTSLRGQRRLRIHNIALNTSNRATDIFRLVDLDCHINWLAKSLAQSIMAKSSKNVTDDLTQRVANILAAYRKNCCNQVGGTGTSNPGELVLPETMKLLPLFAQCLVKSDIIRPGPCMAFNPFPDAVCNGFRIANEIAIDDRSMLLFSVHGMNVAKSASYFYPRVLPLHNLNPDTDDIPVSIRCSYDRLQSDGAYLFENGVNMFLWVGRNVAQDWVQSMFNVRSTQQIQEGAVLREHDNIISRRINNLISQIRLQSAMFCRLIVVRQGDRSEIWLKHFMFEDRTDNCPSYVDYLCHIHKEVRNLLK